MKSIEHGGGLLVLPSSVHPSVLRLRPRAFAATSSSDSPYAESHGRSSFRSPGLRSRASPGGFAPQPAQHGAARSYRLRAPDLRAPHLRSFAEGGWLRQEASLRILHAVAPRGRMDFGLRTFRHLTFAHLPNVDPPTVAPRGYGCCSEDPEARQSSV